MATPRKWSNVAVAMQSTLSAPVAITAITQANPGVVTTGSAHGWSNGSFVLLIVQGMSQVNGRVFRITSASGSVFTLEGENTTNYSAFSATGSTAALITFGTTLTTATTISASGGGFDTIDTTTIHDLQRSSIAGLAQETAFEFDNVWDVADAGLIAMRAAYLAQGNRAFRFTFGAGGQIMVFNGAVAANLLPQGEAQGLVTTPARISLQGEPTYYAS